MMKVYLTQVKCIEYERYENNASIVINVGSLCARELLLLGPKVGKAVLQFRQGGLRYKATVYITRLFFKTGGAELEITEVS